MHIFLLEKPLLSPNPVVQPPELKQNKQGRGQNKQGLRQDSSPQVYFPTSHNTHDEWGSHIQPLWGQTQILKKLLEIWWLNNAPRASQMPTILTVHQLAPGPGLRLSELGWAATHVQVLRLDHCCLSWEATGMKRQWGDHRAPLKAASRYWKL